MAFVVEAHRLGLTYIWHRLISVEQHSRLYQRSCIRRAFVAATRRRGSHSRLREGNAKGKMKIGMTLTRRRQPRKAVGTQILCKRTRARARACARTHLLAYIRSRTYRASSYRAHDHVYAPASMYTSAVIGYRLYRVQQPYGAQPDSWECGLRIVIARARARAIQSLSRYTALRVLRFTTAIAFLSPFLSGFSLFSEPWHSFH